MWKYVLKRVILVFLTAIIILSLTFILIKALPPASPAGFADQVQAFYLKQVEYGYMLDKTELTESLGNCLYNWKDTAGVYHYIYNRPIMDQYFSWVVNIVTKWDWGTSTNVSVGQSAMLLIVERLPVTIKLNLVSVCVYLPIGFGLGIWAALKKNTVTDGIISTSIMVFTSIPSFITITFLLILFAYGLHWFPSDWPSKQAATSEKILAYFIPVFSLSIGPICGYARSVRAELCDIMASDFLLLARTKGLSKSQTVIRHALKNSMVPLFPSLLLEIIGCLSGSMVLEQLYGIPGIGTLFIKALGDPGKTTDYNLLMVDMAVVTLISLFGGLVADLSYGLIDPRIRMGAKK